MLWGLGVYYLDLHLDVIVGLIRQVNPWVSGITLAGLLVLTVIVWLPWDGWGIICQPDGDLTEGDRRLVDHIAALPEELPGSLGEIATLCGRDERVRPPDGWPGA